MQIFLAIYNVVIYKLLHIQEIQAAPLCAARALVVEAFGWWLRLSPPPVRGGALPRLGVLSLSVIFRVCLLFVLWWWCEFRAFGGKFSIPRGARFLLL